MNVESIRGGNRRACVLGFDRPGASAPARHGGKALPQAVDAAFQEA